jgi:alkyl hydroperoxide reductase subunit F
MYDVIIIGGGPAGMTAAIYTARKKLKTLVLAKQLGGQMVWSSEVDNYTGFSFITGAELTQKFEQHLESIKEDLEIKEGVEVVKIEKSITSFQAEDAAGKVYFGRSLIIAAGKEPRHLGIPGEDKFFGRGVAVCATCDAPLYKDKEVAVVGGGNSAMDALLALSKSARRLYSVNVNPTLMGDQILKDKVEHIPSIQFFTNSQVLDIIGDRSVTGVRIQQPGRDGQVISVQGVFVEVGYQTKLGFDLLTAKNEHDEIKVDRNLQSSVPGIFAAGDVNDAWGDQIIIAAGEGAKAAMAAESFLNRTR